MDQKSDSTVEDALQFLLATMNDPEAPQSLRVRAAIAAVQYQRRKKSDGSIKGDRKEQANERSEWDDLAGS